MIELKRPLVVLDCETTGTDILKDRVIELGMLKCRPGEEFESFHEFFNPEMPIPSESIAIHGITDKKVRNKLTFAQMSETVLMFLMGCDLAGFNLIGFDLPLLEAEFLRAGKKFDRAGCSLIDPMVVFHQREKRDLAAAYLKYYGEELKGHHHADLDAIACFRVLEGQLNYYNDLPKTVKELGDLCYDADAFVEPTNSLIRTDEGICINFGKYKGTPLDLVPHSYFQWMLNQDFHPRVDEIVREVLNG